MKKEWEDEVEGGQRGEKGKMNKGIFKFVG